MWGRGGKEIGGRECDHRWIDVGKANCSRADCTNGGGRGDRELIRVGEGW